MLDTKSIDGYTFTVSWTNCMAIEQRSHGATTHEYILNRIDALHEKVDRNAESAHADNRKLLYTIIGAGVALFVSVIGAAAAIAAAIISSSGS